jgi:hypothetical protein
MAVWILSWEGGSRRLEAVGSIDKAIDSDNNTMECVIRRCAASIIAVIFEERRLKRDRPRINFEVSIY